MVSDPGEDAVKTVEMTMKDLECYITLVDKAAAGLERIDAHFECDKMILNSTVCYIEIVHEMKSQLMQQISLYFNKLP